MNLISFCFTRNVTQDDLKRFVLLLLFLCKLLRPITKQPYFKINQHIPLDHSTLLLGRVVSARLSLLKWRHSKQLCPQEASLWGQLAYCCIQITH